MIKAYQIAMYLFVLNLAVMLLAQMPLFGSAFMGQTFTTNMSQDNFTYTFNSTENAYYLAYDDGLIETTNFSGYQASAIDEFGIIEILVMFATAIWNSTLYLPFYLNNLGLHPAIVTFITAPVWFVYAAGMFQFIRGLIIED